MSEISKKICEILSLWCLLTLLALAPNLALSACNLPVPDMGGADVSSPNYTGHLKSIGVGWIVVKDYKSQNVKRISTSELSEAYSAFGGDEKFVNLKSGIAVRVWFKDCLSSPKPSASYVEFFSNNPLDQPPSSYFYKY